MDGTVVLVHASVMLLVSALGRMLMSLSSTRLCELRLDDQRRAHEAHTSNMHTCIYESELSVISRIGSAVIIDLSTAPQYPADRI